MSRTKIETLIDQAAKAPDPIGALQYSQAACNVANALMTASNISDQPGPSDAQIKHMADRFLSWRLPENFNPDNGISFDPVSNAGTDYEMRREPVGTNLLDATQAEAMVRHMVEGMPA